MDGTLAPQPRRTHALQVMHDLVVDRILGVVMRVRRSTLAPLRVPTEGATWSSSESSQRKPGLTPAISPTLSGMVAEKEKEVRNDRPADQDRDAERAAP